MAYELILGLIALALIVYVWKYKVSTLTLVFLVFAMLSASYYFIGEDEAVTGKPKP